MGLILERYSRTSVLVPVLSHLLALLARFVWLLVLVRVHGVVMGHRLHLGCRGWIDLSFSKGWRSLSEFIGNDTCGFQAFECQACVVRRPLVELPELEAAWLVHTRGVTAPEAVWLCCREQLEAAQSQLSWRRSFALVDVY